MLTPRLTRADGWLLYAAPLPERWTGDRAALLAWSGALPGGCKLACAADGRLSVQAELPAFCESAERAAAIAAGFAQAAARLGLCAAPPPFTGALPFAAAPDLAGLCRETGWPFEERADGSLAVDLDVPGAYLPALIEARTDRVAVAAEIVALPEADGPRRAALTVLLLRVNGAFRMLRAVVGQPGPCTRLECELPLAASAAELGEAIAAVAVAARHCALEAQLVAADEGIARAFLERSGMFPPL